jgi:hypothetical protein
MPDIWAGVPWLGASHSVSMAGILARVGLIDRSWSHAAASGSSMTGSSSSQTLIQRRQRLTYQLRPSMLIMPSRPEP